MSLPSLNHALRFLVAISFYSFLVNGAASAESLQVERVLPASSKLTTLLISRTGNTVYGFDSGRWEHLLSKRGYPLVRRFGSLAPGFVPTAVNDKGQMVGEWCNEDSTICGLASSGIDPSSFRIIHLFPNAYVATAIPTGDSKSINALGYFSHFRTAAPGGTNRELVTFNAGRTRSILADRADAGGNTWLFYATHVIDDSGTVYGSYIGTNNPAYAHFVYHRRIGVRQLALPSGVQLDDEQLSIAAVNNKGKLLLRSSNGSAVWLNLKSGRSQRLMLAGGVLNNLDLCDNNSISGNVYFSNSGEYKAFLYRNGQFTMLTDLPVIGTSLPARLRDTFLLAYDCKGSGIMGGSWIDESDSEVHGALLRFRLK